MAGILNSKERVMDVVLTPQGRGQMASGKMKIEFITLSDINTFYQSTKEDNVADDASNRVYFETYSSVSDLITPEVVPGTYQLENFAVNKHVVSGKELLEASSQNNSIVYSSVNIGSDGSSISEIVQNLINNFESLRALKTEDPFSNTSNFVLKYSTGSFLITDADLKTNQGKGIYLKDLAGDGDTDGEIDLDTMPSFYSDLRLSHFPNFKYLPPINVKYKNSKPSPLKDYPRFAAWSDSLDEDPGKKAIQHLQTRQRVSIEFDDISRNKNLFCQMFEFSKGTNSIDKLSIIDAGIIQKSLDDKGSHYFFLGKFMKDSEDIPTFVNIFTLVFTNDEQ